MTSTPTPIQRAADQVGGQSELARRLSETGKSITPQGVGLWCRTGLVPVDRAHEVEHATDGSVRVEELCPHVEWQRDEGGQITGYVTPVQLAS